MLKEGSLLIFNVDVLKNNTDTRFIIREIASLEKIFIQKKYKFNIYTNIKYLDKLKDNIFDKKGNLWSAATSDPGNDGPFETRLFRVGKMSKEGSFSLTRPMKSSKTFENEKVEAMTTYRNGILLLTDNENFGSSRYFINTNKLL